MKFEVHFVRDHLAVCGMMAIPEEPTDEFLAHGFAAHLQLVEGFGAWIGERCKVLSLPFLDGFPVPGPVLDQALPWLAERWQASERTLVTCAAGQSRSVSLAIGALLQGERRGLLAACEEVFRAVPGAYPHPQVLVSVARRCGVEVDLPLLEEVFDSDAITFDPQALGWPRSLLEEAALSTE